ncbi:9957_t:CDS:1, partial [Racocetra fulgida]
GEGLEDQFAHRAKTTSAKPYAKPTNTKYTSSKSLEDILHAKHTSTKSHAKTTGANAHIRPYTKPTSTKRTSSKSLDLLNLHAKPTNIKDIEGLLKLHEHTSTKSYSKSTGAKDKPHVRSTSIKPYVKPTNAKESGTKGLDDLHKLHPEPTNIKDNPKFNVKSTEAKEREKPTGAKGQVKPTDIKDKPKFNVKSTEVKEHEKPTGTKGQVKPTGINDKPKFTVKSTE